MTWTRRRFLSTAAGACVGAAGGMALYAWRVEPFWLDTVYRPLHVSGLPPELTGKTLIQLSDIHIGPRVDDDYLIHTFRHVQSLSPDIIAYTGDFVSWNSAHQYDHLARVAEHFPHGKMATLGILGNHDYGPRWSHLEIADEISFRVRNAGVQMLRNEIAVVKGLSFVGLDDLWSPRFGPEAILASVGPVTPALVLCHNPDACDANVWGGYRGNILSGHTHGGQCKPPFLPPPLLPVRNRRYTAGEFDLFDGRSLYINRGIGYLLPVRFNVRPEVTVFTLQQA
jgi:predicted MPP superfamily phosphohydrolase